jgi:hypothetical protein
MPFMSKIKFKLIEKLPLQGAGGLRLQMRIGPKQLYRYRQQNYPKRFTQYTQPNRA